MNFKQLLNKIDSEKTVFVAGNGINLYAEKDKPKCESCAEYDRCKDENKRRFLSWSAVLKKLCDKRQICLDPEKPFDLSYPEIASLLNLRTLDRKPASKTSPRRLKRDMRMEISGCYHILTGQDTLHEQFLGFMKKNNIPVITTNFDMLFAEKLYEHKVGTGDPALFKPNAKQFWNYCYNENEGKHDAPVIDCRELVDNYAVWYMHGNQKHPSSIVIGLEDYVNSISLAKSMISAESDKEKSRFGLYGAKDDLWIGRNTWLHLFFHRDLVFLGLSLDSQELFLRWLLVQRANYQSTMKIKHKRTLRKAWYVHDDYCKLNSSTPKGVFLTACGVELVPNDNHKVIYDCFAAS